MLALSSVLAAVAFAPLSQPARAASRVAQPSMASKDEFTLAILGDLHVSSPSDHPICLPPVETAGAQL